MPAVSFAVTRVDTSKAQPGSSDPSPEHSRSSPLSATRSNSAYYHPHYPPGSPSTNLVLASSDSASCWFAINREELFCRDDAFRSVGLENVTPDSNLPLIQLGESRAVIEVILSCLQADTIPDFGNIEFRVLVSALEAAADKYRLVHIEKMCLLALGAYCRTHPVEVYTLASHYSCRWLAEAASEHTLSVDITQPEYRDILTSESYSVLDELRHSRVNSAKSILRSQIISIKSNAYSIDEVQGFWAEAMERIIKRISNPSIDFKKLFEPELELALSRFPNCAQCYAALVTIQHNVEAEWKKVSNQVSLSVPVAEPHPKSNIMNLLDKETKA